MGIFDDINKAMKKIEEEVKKVDPSFQQAGSGHQNTAHPATHTHTSHPGYSRITAWMKTRCQGKIAGVSDPYQKNLELEQIAAEATSGLSAKARKGFLDYLKSQNYEQLLK